MLSFCTPDDPHPHSTHNSFALLTEDDDEDTEDEAYDDANQHNACHAHANMPSVTPELRATSWYKAHPSSTSKLTLAPSPSRFQTGRPYNLRTPATWIFHGSQPRL
jgi:hypothetical protein